jgi:multiple sugar transport system permease protein
MNMGKKNASQRTINVMIMALLGVIAVVVLMPYFWLVTTAFKTNEEIFSRNMVWLPAHWRWENFVTGWNALKPYSFLTFFKNSFVLVALCLVGCLISCTLVAYGFSRIDFKFRNGLFVIVLATMMLPSQITMIPMYIIWAKLKFVNTYVPLVLPWFLGSPFYIFLLRQFMSNIPKELDEAAVIDGCSKFWIYYKIILPLSKPAIFTVAIFAFSEVYDDFMGPLIYLSSPKLYTVSMAMRMFFSNDTLPQYGPTLAMSLVCMIPVFLVFVFAQKTLIQGIATTGLKA